jgi:4,5-dihydroxyphthalate decarboxylase
MADLKLTFACWDCDRTRPLMDGRVKPDGIKLDIKVLRPHETYRRMLDRNEFQISELSLASYGIEPNRPTYEALGRYICEQGLSPRVVTADELFAPGWE